MTLRVSLPWRHVTGRGWLCVLSKQRDVAKATWSLLARSGAVGWEAEDGALIAVNLVPRIPPEHPPGEADLSGKQNTHLEVGLFSLPRCVTAFLWDPHSTGRWMPRGKSLVRPAEGSL